jgi:glycosyltransferase involved in cell wall biosynthesis
LAELATNRILAEPDTSARVAVLVACHNDGATIRETLTSLLSEPDIELVVIDDGSTDTGTRETLASLEREGVSILHQENAGPSSAWMRGLSVTLAPYVMPFSSDDLIVGGAIGRLADALDAMPQAAAAWGDLKSFGAADALVPSPPALCPWVVTYVNTIPGIAMFRRTSLLEAGGWQLGTGIEDWDLWMGLARRGYAGVHVAGPSFLYRRDAGGRFRSRVRRFEPFYEELRMRNRELFDARSENRRASPAPAVLKILFPVIDRLPLVSRLLKVQLCDTVSLFFWRAGARRTAAILFQGVRFRIRLLRANASGARARD